MNNNKIYYSQFVRELSLNGLWLDFWLIVFSLVLFIVAPFVRENPLKGISTLFVVRALMTNSIGINNLRETDLNVLTSDDLRNNNQTQF